MIKPEIMSVFNSVINPSRVVYYMYKAPSEIPFLEYVTLDALCNLSHHYLSQEEEQSKDYLILCGCITALSFTKTYQKLKDNLVSENKSIFDCLDKFAMISMANKLYEVSK